MSVSGPVGVSTQPNYFTEKENLVVRSQNTSLSKVILEGSTKSTPSSLQTKKVATVSSEPVLEQEEAGYIPLMFQVTLKHAKGIQSFIDNALTILNEIAQERLSNKDPKYRLNEALCHVATRIYSLLAKAKLAHMKGMDEIERNCIELAKKRLSEELQLSYFHGRIQYAAYMDKAHPEIKEADLVNMNVLRDLLLTLRRAIILDPEYGNASKELKSISEFLPKHWEKLKDEGQLDEETFNRLNENLEQVLKEDPFKDEFIKNPELFKKVKDAPPALLEKYPHLTSPGRFIERYPRAGWIELPNQAFNTENLKLCINQVKTSPLATTLFLLSYDPIITPSHALLIKELLVEKQDLKVGFGNEDDLRTLMVAFYNDTTLVFDEKTAFSKAVYSINDEGGKATVMSITSPIRKAQPIEFRSTKTKGVTLQFEVNSKEIVHSLIGYVLVKGKDPFPVFASDIDRRYIAVKACDSEAIMKLNRRYIDKYGLEAQYTVSITPEELYKQFEKTIEEDRRKGVFKPESSLQSKPVQSKPTESVSALLQSKPTLVEGRVFLVLDGANGSKVLAVRDYEVESVLKLNRKYTDENGITQEYRILGIGPEWYEKLDTIERKIKEKYSSEIESMIIKHKLSK